MKATEARKLVQDRTFKLAQDKLGEIYSTIKTYASQHNEGVTIHLGEIHFSVIKIIMEDLKGNGYTIEHKSGVDMRDHDTWNSLTIGWK